MSLWTWLLLFLAAAAFDATYTFYSRAVATNRKLLATLASGAIPLVGLFEVNCMIQAASIWERIGIGATVALASGLMTWLVLTYFPRATE